MNALIGFCLDESSSMNADRTRDAFNMFLQMQKYRIDDCALFLVKFGDFYEPTVEFQSIFKVPPMSTPDWSKGEDVNPDVDNTKRRSNGRWYETSLHYCPRGGTLLFDSMAYTILEMETYIKKLPADQRPSRVTLVVQTDGGNTDSYTTPAQLTKEITRLRNQGWDVIFLADASDGRGTAESMANKTGFTRDETLVYTDPTKAFEEASDRILESVVTGKLGAPRQKGNS